MSSTAVFSFRNDIDITLGASEASPSSRASLELHSHRVGLSKATLQRLTELAALHEDLVRFPPGHPTFLMGDYESCTSGREAGGPGVHRPAVCGGHRSTRAAAPAGLAPFRPTSRWLIRPGLPRREAHRRAGSRALFPRWGGEHRRDPTLRVRRWLPRPLRPTSSAAHNPRWEHQT